MRITIEDNDGSKMVIETGEYVRGLAERESVHDIGERLLRKQLDIYDRVLDQEHVWMFKLDEVVIPLLAIARDWPTPIGSRSVLSR